jgi:hypothetical protein
MNKPNPVKFTSIEGGEWMDWEYWHKGDRIRVDRVHAVLFEDGSVFDALSGWRTMQYCPRCGCSCCGGGHMP